MSASEDASEARSEPKASEVDRLRRDLLDLDLIS
jgi:hypothetical protein